jgi:hypothetical protein
MKTFRQVINRVLKTISEDPIDPAATELTDDYHSLVATFVNQIKEEIEEAHTWRALWKTFTVTVLAGQPSAVITGASDRARVVRIAQADSGRYVPLVFDVTVGTNPAPLQEIDLALDIYKRTVEYQTNSEPYGFSVSVNSDGLLELRLSATPSVDRTIKITMSNPQPELEDDDLDVNILIPDRALIMGSVYYALAERGEELGVNNIYTEERSRIALDDAIARDMEEQGGLDLVAT